ncbi:MAG: 3-hydroxyacyl-ACP dehydratase FabZ family protein [Rubripirellula sp.]
MSAQEIEQAIPHRPPMRLLDEIVSRTENTIICKKTFLAGEFFVQGHFPEQPIVPGVIQCECCLQAGAILLANLTSGEEGMVPVATRMESVKFKRMVKPGDTVEVHATLNDQVSNAFFLTGKVVLDGKVATRLDFACSVAKPG